MKRILLALTSAAAVFAAGAKDAYDIRPEAKGGEALTAVEWQNTNNTAIAEATTIARLRADLLSDVMIAQLLAAVKPAYATDPLVATRIGALTQMAMCRKWSEAPQARARWTAALLKAARESKDAYRTMFFLDQLRWCGLAAQAKDVRAIGADAKETCVKDFAAWVAKEIAGRK